MFSTFNQSSYHLVAIVLCSILSYRFVDQSIVGRLVNCIHIPRFLTIKIKETLYKLNIENLQLQDQLIF